jgi:F0F1-type ATP synthase assembly protein I
MDKNEPNPNTDNGKPLNNYAKFTGLAFQMIAVIGVFAYAGYKIDEGANHTTKWVTAMLSLVGVFISLYIVIRSVKN